MRDSSALCPRVTSTLTPLSGCRPAAAAVSSSSLFQNGDRVAGAVFEHGHHHSVQLTTLLLNLAGMLAPPSAAAGQQYKDFRLLQPWLVNAH